MTSINGSFTLNTALMPNNGYAPSYGYDEQTIGWIATRFTAAGPDSHNANTAGSPYPFLFFYDVSGDEHLTFQDYGYFDSGTYTYRPDGQVDTSTYGYLFNAIFLHSNTDVLDVGMVDGKFVPTAFHIDQFQYQGYAYMEEYSQLIDYQYDATGSYLGYRYSEDYQTSYAQLTELAVNSAGPTYGP